MPIEVAAAALRILLLAGTAYVAVGVLLWAFQERLIFHPRPLAFGSGHPAATAIEIDRGDAILRGWIVNEAPCRQETSLRASRPPAPLLVYFGGNAEEVSGNIGNFAPLPAITVLVNYRGYGESTGTPSEHALVEDAVAVVEWARHRCSDRPLVLFGNSLGAGVAVLAAARVVPDAAILVSPYRSVARIAKARFPIFPVRWMLRHPFDAEAAAAHMPPMLAFASPIDRVIPFAESEAMVAVLKKTGREVELRMFNLPHSAFMGHLPVWQAIDAFLAARLPAADAQPG